MTHWIDDNTVLGVFTHRTTYLEILRPNVKEMFPDVQYLEQYAQDNIRNNFSALLQKCREIGKRFAIFIDDDIIFLDKRTIRIAVGTLLNNRWDACTVYSIFDKNAITAPYAETEQRLFAAYPPDHLIRTVTWMPGYFMCVDMSRMGHVDPDMGSPAPSIGHDTMYSVRILREGGIIGVAPTVVYHVDKKATGLKPWIDPKDAEAQLEYAINTYGPLYAHMTHYLNSPVVVDWQEIMNNKSQKEHDNAQK